MDRTQRSRLLTKLFTEAGPCGRSYPAVDQCPYRRSATLWIQILDGAAKYWQHSVVQMFLLTFIVSWPLHWMLGPLTARRVHQGVSGLTISLNPTFNDLVGYDWFVPLNNETFGERSNLNGQNAQNTL